MSTVVELCREFYEQYGQTCGPLVFQLQHETCNIRQGNQKVNEYYNKLKQCWDELNAILSRVVE